MSFIKRTLCQSLAVMLLLLGSSISHAQPKSSAHLLLGSQYGEFCTMCEAFVVCLPQSEVKADQPPLAALPASGDYTLYYFPTRTFWQQVYTIWEWFKMMFVTINSHGRPLGIYTPDGTTLSYQTGETQFSIDPPEITVPDGMIKRDNGNWLDQNKQVKGQCYRLPLWETLDEVAKLAPATQQAN